VVKEGESIWVQVESIDDAQRRVALRRISEDQAQAPEAAKPEKQKRPRVGRRGGRHGRQVRGLRVFVHWDGGKGLVPNPELGTPRGSDNKKTVPPGTQFKRRSSRSTTAAGTGSRGRRRSARRASPTTASTAADEQEDAAGQGLRNARDLLRAKLEQQSEDE